MAQAVPFIAANWQGIAAGVGAAAAVGGTAASIQQSRKATRAQEKADAASRAAAEIQNQRQIRQQLLASRRAQAQVIASGQSAQGGFGSSSIAGATGSIATQGAANIGFANTQLGAGNAIAGLTNQARNAASNAQTFGAIAALPGQFGFGLGAITKQRVDQADTRGVG